MEQNTVKERSTHWAVEMSIFERFFSLGRPCWKQHRHHGTVLDLGLGDLIFKIFWLKYLAITSVIYEQGQVWYLIVSIPDPCCLSYFDIKHL